MLEMIRTGFSIAFIIFISVVLILYTRGYWNYGTSVFNKIRTRSIDGFMRLTQNFNCGVNAVKSGTFTPGEEVLNYSAGHASDHLAGPEKTFSVRCSRPCQRSDMGRLYKLKILK